VASHPDQDWLDANQRYLAAAISSIRRSVAPRDSRTEADRLPEPETPEPLTQSSLHIAQEMSPPPALDTLCSTLGLTPFERALVLLCAAAELDGSFASACGRAQGDEQRSFPTFGLALAVLPHAHWSALLPNAPLRFWHLIEFAAGGSPSAPVTTRPLRIDERVLHYLTGLAHLDERLAGLVTQIDVDGEIVPTHREIARHVVAAWTGHDGRTAQPLVALYGPDPGSARAIAAFAARSCGWQPFRLSERLIPSSAADVHLFSRLWEREVRLGAAALVIECDDGASETHRELLRDWLDRANGPIVIVSRERRQLGPRPTASFEVSKPTADEQRALWNLALHDHEPARPDVSALTSQFSLSRPEILSAAEEARADASPLSTQAVWTACRRQTRGRLDDLAQRIESQATFDDLVLPDSQKEILMNIVTHVRHRATVLNTWGFAGQGSRGLGISALFAGASGTGKTMSAEVLAGVLELDLYRIDLSAVVSKYIGETEKNLRRIFDAADSGGVILLFDEADALFGKRSEVKDSHDRYANIEVSYLLQRMESYRGLAILTTNMRSALDVAFLRRIRFIVQFPFPDAGQRAEIWRKVFPRDTPTYGLDVERLAQLSVAGGSIRNVALNAAFLAVDSNEPVGMSHVLTAARSEYAKLEKSLTDAEVAGWV
jgi:SpoVK/Ycf46/Vps4 family AAA+-type ATPase